MLRSLVGVGPQLPNPTGLNGLQLVSLWWKSGVCCNAWLVNLGAQRLPLTELRLDEFKRLSGAGLCELRTLTSLKLLDCWEISSPGLAAVADLPLLTHLHLYNCAFMRSRGLKALHGARRLRHLSLAHCKQVLRQKVFIPLSLQA